MIAPTTGKNKDIVEGVLSVLSKLIPNRSKDTNDNGDFITHAERKIKKIKERRKKD